MKLHTILMYTVVATGLLLLVCPVQAEQVAGQNVIYQTAFTTDPRWTTNNPSTDFWDPNLGMYHFSIEPSTGSYAYAKVPYDGGPFTLEYDLILNRIDGDATFRLGLSGAEMDLNKGPNVLTEFSHGKYGQIMGLHLITPGSKMLDIKSQTGVTSYPGPTVKYEVNNTYHVTVVYDDDHKMVTMKVSEKTTGKEIWGYYLNTWESLHGMNRIYLGSKGDYGTMGISAQGYIDNIRLSVSAVGTPTLTVVTTEPTTIPTAITTLPITRPTTAVPTPTATQKSPLSAPVVCAAAGVGAAVHVMFIKRKN